MKRLRRRNPSPNEEALRRSAPTPAPLANERAEALFKAAMKQAATAPGRVAPSRPRAALALVAVAACLVGILWFARPHKAPAIRVARPPEPITRPTPERLPDLPIPNSAPGARRVARAPRGIGAAGKHATPRQKTARRSVGTSWLAVAVTGLPEREGATAQSATAEATEQMPNGENQITAAAIDPDGHTTVVSTIRYRDPRRPILALTVTEAAPTPGE